jgi:hypothetical protein
MRKIFSILLCVLFLFNVSGYFVVFKLMQYNARQEMQASIKNKIPDNEIKEIIIPNSEIALSSLTFRFVHENEIIYNGCLYDIVKKRTNGNNTIFYCVLDTQENRLVSGLNENFKRNTDQVPAKNKTNPLTQNIIKEALPENKTSFKIKLLSTETHFNYLSNILEEYIPVFSPPPKA